MSLILLRLTISLFIPLTLLLSPYVRVGFPPTIPLAVRFPYLNCWLPYDRSLATTFNHSQVCHLRIFRRP